MSKGLSLIFSTYARVTASWLVAPTQSGLHSWRSVCDLYFIHSLVSLMPYALCTLGKINWWIPIKRDFIVECLLYSVITLLHLPNNKLWIVDTGDIFWTRWGVTHADIISTSYHHLLPLKQLPIWLIWFTSREYVRAGTLGELSTVSWCLQERLSLPDW